MKRPTRFRPALEQLEDRWCPSLLYNVNGGPFMPPPHTVNAVNGALGLADNDSFPTVTITYEGSQEYQVVDGGTYYFTGVTSLTVTLGGIQDTLMIDGNFTGLGGGLNSTTELPGYVSVALDGTAPSGSPNSFTFHDAFLNTNSASNSTLYVLGQGGNNNVVIGTGGSDFTDVYMLNITYRDAANGPNPGTPNDGDNYTTMNRLWNVGMSLSSQSAFATDYVTAGSSVATPQDPNTGVVENYGSANFSFNQNNNFNLSLANGFVGSSYLPSAQFTVTGGGPSSTVNLGDGINTFTVQTGTTVIDLDDTSGNQDGTINVYAGVTLNSGSVERFDDYGTVNIAPNGGTVALARPLTIWNSDGGSTVTLGTATGGTVTGNLTFDTGRISGDSDDGGSNSGVQDTLTVASGATLSGTLTANLNTSQDTIDVEGHVTGSLNVTATGSNGADTVDVGATTPGAAAKIDGSATLNLRNANFNTVTIGAPGETATIAGNSTITLGSGSSVVDAVTVDAAAVFKNKLSIALGSGNETLYFDGTVGPTLSTATNLTVTSGVGATVFATLGANSVVNGSVSMNLSHSTSNVVDWELGSFVTRTLFLTGNSSVLANQLDPDTAGSAHTPGVGPNQYDLLSAWTLIDDGDD